MQLFKNKLLGVNDPKVMQLHIIVRIKKLVIVLLDNSIKKMQLVLKKLKNV